MVFISLISVCFLFSLFVFQLNSYRDLDDEKHMTLEKKYKKLFHFNQLLFNCIYTVWLSNNRIESRDYISCCFFVDISKKIISFFFLHVFEHLVSLVSGNKSKKFSHYMRVSSLLMFLVKENFTKKFIFISLFMLSDTFFLSLANSAILSCVMAAGVTLGS